MRSLLLSCLHFFKKKLKLWQFQISREDWTDLIQQLTFWAKAHGLDFPCFLS